MKTNKTAWTVFSIRELKAMIEVAKEIQKQRPDFSTGTDADCVIIGFRVDGPDNQLSMESARPVADQKNHYLPANLMSRTYQNRLMPYRGEHTTGNEI